MLDSCLVIHTNEGRKPKRGTAFDFHASSASQFNFRATGCHAHVHVGMFQTRIKRGMPTTSVGMAPATPPEKQGLTQY